jgi:hypothetical protein
MQRHRRTGSELGSPCGSQARRYVAGGVVDGPLQTNGGGALFEQLFAISRDAHARRQHEVAYHSLSAAMHAAEDAHDAQSLRTIVQEAQTQISWIDHNAPGHRLSTTSARRHNHPGVYVMLGRQAETIAAMLDPRGRRVVKS